jgi:hypothetical protein
VPDVELLRDVGRRVVDDDGLGARGERDAEARIGPKLTDDVSDERGLEVEVDEPRPAHLDAVAEIG